MYYVLNNPYQMMFEINNIIFICSILREKHVHCRMCVLTLIIVNFIFI